MYRHLERPLESYPGTHRWIFDEKTTPFRTWLTRGNGVFWISGKPGSGKSTLMAFLFGHSATLDGLRHWAGTDVVTASFFFWTAGNRLERSQVGLFRSLLYQVLSQQPHLTREAVPHRLGPTNFPASLHKPWSRRELVEALHNVVASSQQRSHFCFFIDGLDEYEGDQYELIEDIDLLATLTSVKLCVASRPWNSFLTAYGGDRDRRLLLHHLTTRDLEVYVHGMLGGNDKLSRLLREKKKLDHFSHEITQRAEGVFLWVTLAVKSLRRGLAEGDSFQALQQRLEAFPSELDDFLQQILDSIEPVYLKYTGRTLLLMRSTTDLPLIWLHFLEQDATDKDFPFRGKIGPLCRCEVVARLFNAVARMNTWCRDLLEATTPNPSDLSQLKYNDECLPGRNNCKLQFLHRTIADFILGKHRDGVLHDMAGDDFDPISTEIRLITRLSKNVSNVSEFCLFAHHLMPKIFHSEQEEGNPSTRILQEFDLVGQAVRNSNDAYHWTSRILVRSQAQTIGDAGQIEPTVHEWLVQYRTDLLPADNRSSSLLTYAINLGLELYPSRQLHIEPSAPSDGREYREFRLECALIPMYRQSGAAVVWIYQAYPRKKIALNLIARCANKEMDINKPIVRLSGKRYSVWQRFLVQLHETRYWDNPGYEVWDVMLEIVSAMLDAGADPRAPLHRDDLYPFLYESDADAEEEKTRWEKAQLTTPALEAFESLDLDGTEHFQRRVVEEYFPKVKRLLIASGQQLDASRPEETTKREETANQEKTVKPEKTAKPEGNANQEATVKSGSPPYWIYHNLERISATILMDFLPLLAIGLALTQFTTYVLTLHGA